MQLAYVWIKKSENGFIDNNEFNFYGEHCFKFIKHNDKSFELTYEKLDIMGSEIFIDAGVKNITAIVGGNGSGKTTLIEELKLLGTTEYDDKFLQVFEHDKSFYYNTNIPINKIKFKVEISEVSLSETNTSRILTSNSSYINNNALWDYTLFEIGKYGERFFELLFRINGDQNLKSLKGHRKKPQIENGHTKYDFLNDLYNPIEVNAPERFQSMCDLLFFYDVFTKEKNFLGKRKLEISFEIDKYAKDAFSCLHLANNFIKRNVAKYCELGKQLYSNLFIELFEERFFWKEPEKYYFYAYQEEKYILELLSSKNIDGNILEIFMFYLSTDDTFIVECNTQIRGIETETVMIIDSKVEENKYPTDYFEDNDLNDIINLILDSEKANSNEEAILKKFQKNIIIDDQDDYNWILEELKNADSKILDLSEIINRCFEEFILIYNECEKDSDYVLNLLMALNQDRTTTEMEKYFRDAITEINEFIEITKNSSYFKISTEDGKDLMEFICKKILSIEKNPSFVLRHIIKINGLEMSSGERAMTNFFSWINTMPQLPGIIPEGKEKLKNNVLLLIDEIDLYAHPEWQRQLIQVLCNSASSIFEKHAVQIILTTHSPFVLSDIPSENIIYLKSTDGKLHTEHPNMKTFGSNIYTLLKNSFFMDSTMGEFSQSIIKKINNSLDRLGTEELLSKTEYAEYEKKIKEIGEPIVQRHLNEKLKRKLSIAQKIADLKAEITRLEDEANDKN